MGCQLGMKSRRHCEERSDEAIALEKGDTERELAVGKEYAWLCVPFFGEAIAGHEVIASPKGKAIVFGPGGCFAALATTRFPVSSRGFARDLLFPTDLTSPGAGYMIFRSS